MSNTSIIDVQYHVVPPEYVRKLQEIGIEGSHGIPFPKWDPKKNLSRMDKVGVGTAILSMSTPGLYFKSASFAADLARLSNEYMKEAVTAFPARYGAFTALPFPAQEESLKELEYAMDSLKLDGVCLLSNAGGVELGSPGYDELFSELNRRKAVVFIHPDDWVEREEKYIAMTICYDRPVDTLRAVYSLLRGGYLEKYPDITYILAHGGGGTAVLRNRMIAASLADKAGRGDMGVFEIADEEIRDRMHLFDNVYYDSAQIGDSPMNSLNEMCGSGKMVFGSDNPYQSATEGKMIRKGIEKSGQFQNRDRNKIFYENVESLLPALAERRNK